MTIVLAVATWRQPEWLRCVTSWNCPYVLAENMDIVPAYQKMFESLHDADVIGYVHDDLVCLEYGWQERVLAEFEDPHVALVGFAGAPGQGHPLMYQVPYHHASMGRVGFRSNMANAEIHGQRFSGSCNAAVLDGLAIFVRRNFLRDIGGWPTGTPVSYFMYAEWLCCMARRHGKKIRVAGVACDHLGGRSTGLNPNLNPDFEAEHRYIYEEFRDVLPARVQP